MGLISRVSSRTYRAIYTMGVDYYAILNVNRNANNDDIAQAYRKLAIRLHPDKIAKSREENLNTKDINRPPDGISPALAHEQCLRIAEAYDVLCDRTKRAMYDQFGEEGLEAGVPNAGKNGAWSSGYSFHGDADKVFRDFFGTDNPFADFSDMNWCNEQNDADGAPMSFGSSTHGRSERVKDKAVVKTLPLTLLEMYHGCLKKVTISRRVMNEDGHTSSLRDKVLTIQVRPGISAGQKIVFKEEGNQGPNIIPADIVFQITQVNHQIFERNGNDLEFTASVPLSRALVGCSIEVPTLDGREISVPVNDIIHPKYTKVVKKEGMPVYGDSKKRGNLIIRFDIEFPSKLSPEAKGMIRQAFAYNSVWF